MMFKHQVVILDVTQDDIDHGHPCNSTKCPVATALIRALGGGPDIVVSVSCVSIAFIQDGEVWDVDTPTPVATFIQAFDNQGDAATYGWVMEPFKCHLVFTYRGEAAPL